MAERVRRLSRGHDDLEIRGDPPDGSAYAAGTTRVISFAMRPTLPAGSFSAMSGNGHSDPGR